MHNVWSGSLLITDINQCEYFAVDNHVLKPLNKNASSIQKVHPKACSRCGLMQSSVRKV